MSPETSGFQATASAPPVRYAILSDVHANLPALKAVLADIDTRAGVTGVYHLGDLVGYAPWPNEVVELLSRRSIPGVAGNYDSTTATRHEHCGCRYESPEQEALSHESYAWTLEHVSAETRRRLAALPFRIDLRPSGGHAAGPKAVLVHGAPTLNTLYWTEDRSDDFCRNMAERADLSEGDAVLFGHTHVPWTREVDGILFVNTGSVGRPKDGDSRAGYLLLDAPDGGEAAAPTAAPAADAAAENAGSVTESTVGAGGWHARHVRVPYEVERAARAVEESDLPDAFAEVLRTGGGEG